MNEIRRSEDAPLDDLAARLEAKLAQQNGGQNRVRLASTDDRRLVVGDGATVPALQSGAIRLSGFGQVLPDYAGPGDGAAYSAGSGDRPGDGNEEYDPAYDPEVNPDFARDTEPIRPRRVPSTAPTMGLAAAASRGGLRGLGKFQRLAQEIAVGPDTVPTADGQSGQSGNLHNHPHFVSYLQNQTPQCPKCGRQMLAHGHGDHWYWKCLPACPMFDGPDHYEQSWSAASTPDVGPSFSSNPTLGAGF